MVISFTNATAIKIKHLIIKVGFLVETALCYVFRFAIKVPVRKDLT